MSPRRAASLPPRETAEMRLEPGVDVIVAVYSSMYVLRPTNATVAQALKKHAPHGQWSDGQIAIGPSEIRSVVEQLMADGLIVWAER